MTQIALPLAWAADPADGGFLVTPSNAAAVRTLERWAAWPVMTALLVGPPRSGRSLLARIFAANSRGRAVDDAAGQDEAQLFHAWNEAQALHRPMVIVAPEAWQPRLPDLRTRLAAGPVARIGDPDDALVAALVRRRFDEARLHARDDLIAWIAARVERRHAAVIRVVDAINAASAARQRPPSIALARATLGEDPTFAVRRLEEP